MSISIGRRCAAFISVASLAISLAPSAYAADWKPGVPRTAYVNLFEWSWSSIARECVTSLGPKGYAAVQVSPPQEHIKGAEWWTRYQPVSYKIASRSGNRAEFAFMVKACKSVGVDVYVDTVINHMAGASGVGTAGSVFGNYNFPGVPYTRDSFHQPSCSIQGSDYDNLRENVTNCDLPGLPDLDTSKAQVQNSIAAYMKDLLSLGVAGFRIDAAKHIKPEELAAIKAKVPGNYFITQEVIKDGSLYNSGDINRYPEIGTVNEFSYIYAMKNMFLNLYGFNLSRMPEAFANWGLYPSDKATVFVNNHDTERKSCDKYVLGAQCDSMNTFNGDQLFLANIFMLAYPYGYPQVMSGYYFNGHDMGPVDQPYKGFEFNPSNCSSDPMAVGKWDCVHRDARVANMVGFRNYTAGAPLRNWINDGDSRIAFNRGNKGFVAINNTDTAWVGTLNVNLPDSTYCNVVNSTYPEIGFCADAAKVVVINGKATINIAPKSAMALHFGATSATSLVKGSLLINVADSLNVARAAEVVSKKSFYFGLKSEYLYLEDDTAVSINGGSFTHGPVKISTGQFFVLKTTAPATDHTVKFVNIKMGALATQWKVATSGNVCNDNYCPIATPLDYSPANIVGGKPVTLYYMGSLANSSTISLHWGNSGWNNVADTLMTKRSDGFWSATITPPASATAINFVVTDGTNWDNNGGANWNLNVTPTNLPVTVSFKVTAETAWGESVYIVGNRAELGNWSTAPEDYRKCSANAYPEWNCVITFPSTGSTIEYKYQKLGNGNTTWENGGNYVYSLPATNAEVNNGAFR
jgi:alpha-amylase